MAILLLDIPTISEGDVELAGIDGTPWLDGLEIFTGTPTVVELGKITSYDTAGHPVIVASTDLTFANESINDLPKTIKNKSVGSGRAILFKVSGQLAGNTYAIKVTCSTTSTPARTKVFTCRMIVK